MTPGVTPYEYYQEVLGCKVKYLVSDDRTRHAQSLDLISYKALNKRIKSRTCLERELRKGSWSHDALVCYDSLSAAWKAKLSERFGEPAQQAERGWFAGHYRYDQKAFDYYSAYRYGSDKEQKLPPEVARKYAHQASVMNMVLVVKEERKSMLKAIGSTQQRDIWETLSRDVNAFDEVAHGLPTTKGSLRYKVTKYKAEGYKALISKKYGQRNAALVKQEAHEAFLQEFLRKHQNLNYHQVAFHYNRVCGEMGWPALTPSTVANYQKKYSLYTHAGRHGQTDFRNKKTMQVKRTRPSRPMVYWTLDGWDVELVYQRTGKNSEGHEVTTYTHRLNAVMVLDPFNDYIIGYAVGERENPELIKAAVRNAIQHTRELFGSRYRPLQLQSDRYQIKHMTPFFEAMTDKYTPAQVRNAKSKVIEPWFNYLNRKHFQAKLVPNWSGHNIDSKKENQPNKDYLNKIKKQFPDEQGCRAQIDKALADERAENQAAYVAGWTHLPAEDRYALPDNMYLRWFGKTTGFTNRLRGDGLVVTLEGATYTYDSFDINWRKQAHHDWCVHYDPEDLTQVLVVNAKGDRGKLVKKIDTIEFMLDKKYEQPMALYDRQPGDAAELQKVFDHNRRLEQHVLDKGNENMSIIQEVFDSHPQLDTMRKLLLSDSEGQHKDPQSSARLAAAMGDLPAPSGLPEAYEIVEDDIMEQY